MSFARSKDHQLTNWRGLATFVMILISLQNATAEALTRLCSSESLRSTTYYVPAERDFKKRSDFIAAVKIQGSGVRRDGRLQRYNGRVEKLRNGCTTAIGASGRCLMPFFSIAGDTSSRWGNHMGDIIFVPELKGKKVRLPNGRVIIHPGLFIIDDHGSAIRGKNRFDFFTGTMSPKDKNNAFTSYRGRHRSKLAFDDQAPISMVDRHVCDKTVEVIHRTRRNMANYQKAYDLIQKAYNGTNDPAQVVLLLASRAHEGQR